MKKSKDTKLVTIIITMEELRCASRPNVYRNKKKYRRKKKHKNIKEE